MRVNSVTSVKVWDWGIVPGFKFVLIQAEGLVPTSGWTHPRLVPYVDDPRPKDKMFEVDFVADSPTGMVLQVISAVGAERVIRVPDWAVGIRVRADSNSMDQLFAAHSTPLLPATPVSFSMVSLTAAATNAIVRREIAVFDDSFQPTGTIHWKNDGPFGTPNPHVEMKKLRHSLVITVEAPDENQIRKCLNDALQQGVLAAVIAAFLSAGIGAIGAFVATVKASLIACIGSATIRFEDESHWIYWDT